VNFCEKYSDVQLEHLNKERKCSQIRDKENIMGLMKKIKEENEEKALFSKLVSSAEMIGELANHTARLEELKQGIAAEYIQELQYHLEMFYLYCKTMEAKEEIEGHIQKKSGNIYVIEETNTELHDNLVIEAYVNQYNSGKGCIVQDWHLTKFYKTHCRHGTAHFGGMLADIPVEGTLVRLKRLSLENKQAEKIEEDKP